MKNHDQQNSTFSAWLKILKTSWSNPTSPSNSKQTTTAACHLLLVRQREEGAGTADWLGERSYSFAEPHLYYGSRSPIKPLGHKSLNSERWPLVNSWCIQSSLRTSDANSTVSIQVSNTLYNSRWFCFLSRSTPYCNLSWYYGDLSLVSLFSDVGMMMMQSGMVKGDLSQNYEGNLGWMLFTLLSLSDCCLPADSESK